MQPQIAVQSTPQKPKKNFLLYFCCGAFALILLTLFLKKPTQEERAASKAAKGKAIEQKNVAKEDSTRVAFKAQKENTATAKTLLADYKSDEYRADNRYKGRKIYVEGIIDLINVRSRYGNYLTLTGDKFGPSVSCSLEDKKTASHLKQGDYVAVYGMCKGLEGHAVYIANAHVVPTVAAWKDVIGDK